jgi:hypothetical protein
MQAGTEPASAATCRLRTSASASSRRVAESRPMEIETRSFQMQNRSFVLSQCYAVSSGCATRRDSLAANPACSAPSRRAPSRKSRRRDSARLSQPWTREATQRTVAASNSRLGVDSRLRLATRSRSFQPSAESQVAAARLGATNWQPNLRASSKRLAPRPPATVAAALRERQVPSTPWPPLSLQPSYHRGAAVPLIPTGPSARRKPRGYGHYKSYAWGITPERVSNPEPPDSQRCV